jgi:tRNA(fMet)-specific endonuclease VapC
VILLETDHFSALEYRRNPSRSRLLARMAASADTTFVTSAVTAEEDVRGWLAIIHRSPQPRDQIASYRLLVASIRRLAQWRILDLDEAAVATFERLRRERVRIGSMDLKIASIALTHDALLLSANLRDFQQVPGLRVEDWLA